MLAVLVCCKETGIKNVAIDRQPLSYFLQLASGAWKVKCHTTRDSATARLADCAMPPVPNGTRLAKWSMS